VCGFSLDLKPRWGHRSTDGPIFNMIVGSEEIPDSRTVAHAVLTTYLSSVGD
jgi:hypothetical protein